MDAMVEDRPGVTSATSVLTKNVGPFEVRYTPTDIRLKNGQLLNLTRKEVMFLSVLLSNAGNYVSRQEILRQAWPEWSGGDSKEYKTHTIETHKSRLVKKLKAAGAGIAIRCDRSGSYCIFLGS